MRPSGIRIPVGGESVSGLLLRPEGAKALYLFAHGAGTNMTHTSYSSVRWNGDGSGLLHNSGRNDRSNIWLQPLDGSPPRKITQFDDDYVLRFDVSPDGRQLAIVRGTLSRDAVLIENFR